MVSTAPESLGDNTPGAPAAEVELAQLRAAHQDLLRAISHDLRAPLRHITAFAPLLREIVAPAALPPAEHAEALEFLDTMEHAGQRMGRMIDGLLALSCIQAAPLRIETVDLQHLLPQVVDEVSLALQGRTITWQIPPQLPAVQADAQLLRQLLKELLANAVKFTRLSCAPCIAVSCARDAAGLCHLSVRDNGVGFDMARSKGLFGLFQRLHPERAFEGVGAGLALVAAVAARHGGSVGAQAEVGQGCTVTLQWPG
ncbi:MAG: sensor histidine kinase [Giesbergeria sp.]